MIISWSFSAAAQELALMQSAVSRQVMALEDEICAKRLARGRARLTSAPGKARPE
jgi:DNA-binding transcriptional LysR family regulator